MTEETRRARLEIAEQFLAQVGRSDLKESMELLSPDVVYRVPGKHALAGVFSGRAEVLEHLVALYQRTIGTFDTYKWEDWMVGEFHVAALADMHVHMEGRNYRGQNLYLVRFDENDKIVDITVLFEDERAIERFIGD